MEIYLDNAATTKIDDRVVDAMMPYLKEEYGNPGSLHLKGARARDAIESARSSVARLLNCDAGEVIFTSGGTESNATAISAYIEENAMSAHKNIVVTETEHKSVLAAVEKAKRFGFRVTYLKPTSDPNDLIAGLKEVIVPDAGLVSVMYVNNETGAVNPVEEIGKICKANGLTYHVDCVQAAGCHPIDVKKIGCDFLSISGHKIHGPKGVGALFAKREFHPLISGGFDQEFGLRGGTENVPGIVGLGAASSLVDLSDINYVSLLKQTFYHNLTKELQALKEDTGVSVNGPSVITPGRILNLKIDGVDAQTLVLMMSAKGVYISAGSACNSHDSEPSHVLLSMGLTPEEARSSVRVSFSRMNTASDVVRAATVMAECIQLLRKCNE